MEELSTLQDRVPPFPNEEAMAIVREELGVDDLTEVFTEMSVGPVAAASIGQVYRARLRETGEEVAIKVQRPGVDAVCTRDLFWLRLVAENLLENISRKSLGCAATLLMSPPKSWSPHATTEPSSFTYVRSNSTTYFI